MRRFTLCTCEECGCVQDFWQVRGRSREMSLMANLYRPGGTVHVWRNSSSQVQL